MSLSVILRMPKYMRLSVACVLLTASILSCAESETSSAKESTYNENILRYDVNAPLTSLDTTKVQTSGSILVLPLLYSRLFLLNPDGELEPDLATKWTYDVESHTWSIHLRKDVLFHNTQPVTARDVKYSLEAKLKNICPSILSLIDSISTPSDAELSIHLKKDYPEFPRKLQDTAIVPHRNGDKTDYYNHPIGSGPFKFAYRKGENEVGLVANKDYYDGRPSLDGVVFSYQPDKEKTWTRLLSGRTDIAQEISPVNFGIMKQYQQRYYFDCYAMPYYAILLYNTTTPPFSDPNVRRALSYAIDKHYIVKNILKGLGVVAVGPMGVDSPFHNQHIMPIPYDPKKALTLLKKAGWSYDDVGRYLSKEEKRFEFTILLFEEYQVEKRVAQHIRLCLNDLGIRADLHSFPHSELIAKYRRNNEFQAVLTEFTCAYRDPEWIRELWAPHLSQKSRAGCFQHPEVSRLIHNAIEEIDPSKQKELFFQVDALITSLQPGTFLFHKIAIDAMSRRFSLPLPFALDQPGIHRLKYASLRSN